MFFLYFSAHFITDCTETDTLVLFSFCFLSSHFAVCTGGLLLFFGVSAIQTFAYTNWFTPQGYQQFKLWGKKEQTKTSFKQLVIKVLQQQGGSRVGIYTILYSTQDFVYQQTHIYIPRNEGAGAAKDTVPAYTHYKVVCVCAVFSEPRLQFASLPREEVRRS